MSWKNLKVSPKSLMRSTSHCRSIHAALKFICVVNAFYSILGVVHKCIKMAMSEEHRKLLRMKRVDLVRDMQIDEELLSCLMTNGIVTSEMKETIEVGEMLLLISPPKVKQFG